MVSRVRLQQWQHVHHSVTSVAPMLGETVYLLGRLPAGRPLSLDQSILLPPRLFDIVLLLGLQHKKRFCLCYRQINMTRIYF